MAEDLKNEQPEKNSTLNVLGENESIQQVLSFFKKYQMYFGIAIAAILLFVVYKQFFGKKTDAAKELKTEMAIYGPLEKKQMDSFNIALNGDSTTEGLLSIIKKNKNTQAANMARVQAAMCYLNTDRPKEAMKLLEDASGFGKQLDARRLSLIADAKGDMAVENGTMNNKMAEEAISSYKKAADAFPEDDLSAAYLLKAGELSEKIGKAEEAKKIYLKIKEKYPSSVQMQMVEKLLGKVGVEN